MLLEAGSRKESVILIPINRLFFPELGFMHAGRKKGRKNWDRDQGLGLTQKFNQSIKTVVSGSMFS